MPLCSQGFKIVNGSAARGGCPACGEAKQRRLVACVWSTVQGAGSLHHTVFCPHQQQASAQNGQIQSTRRVVV